MTVLFEPRVGIGIDELEDELASLPTEHDEHASAGGDDDLTIDLTAVEHDADEDEHDIGEGRELGA